MNSHMIELLLKMNFNCLISSWSFYIHVHTLMFLHWSFANKVIITFTTSKFGWRNIECGDLGATCDVWCHTPCVAIKIHIAGIVYKNSQTWLLLNGSQSVVMHCRWLMAKWFEQASQWHEMYCHDLEVKSSNPGRVELEVLGTSVLNRTWIKISVSCDAQIGHKLYSK